MTMQSADSFDNEYTPQARGQRKDIDPQLIFEGTLKEGPKSDYITFRWRIFPLVDLIFIVTLPNEGSTTAPVYMKTKIVWSGNMSPGTPPISG
jgi:hypothetical protein